MNVKFFILLLLSCVAISRVSGGFLDAVKDKIDDVKDSVTGENPEKKDNEEKEKTYEGGLVKQVLHSATDAVVDRVAESAKDSAGNPLLKPAISFAAGKAKKTIHRKISEYGEEDKEKETKENEEKKDEPKERRKRSVDEVDKSAENKPGLLNKLMGYFSANKHSNEPAEEKESLNRERRSTDKRHGFLRRFLGLGRRTETEKSAPAKPAPKAEAVSKPEPPKSETTTTQATKPETEKSEPPKPETDKPEPPKPEMQKPVEESAKTEGEERKEETEPSLPKASEQAQASEEDNAKKSNDEDNEMDKSEENDGAEENNDSSAEENSEEEPSESNDTGDKQGADDLKKDDKADEEKQKN